MSLNFSCPHCGARTLVDDQFSGKSGPCYTCGKRINVPAVAKSTAEASPSPVETTPRKVPSTSTAVLLSIVGLGIAGAIGVMALIINSLNPYIEQVQASMHRTGCDRNLVQIAKALQAYHQKHGSYPPSSIADKDGNPMHSWRVLILPELGEHSLYKQYNFDLPWNNPANLKVAERMPAVFACPTNPDILAAHETSYMVIVGKGTAFPGPNQTTRHLQFEDGLANTLLFVESMVTGVLWTDPSDLQSSNIKFDINGKKGNGIGSDHNDGAFVVTADGRHHFLNNSSPPDYVRALSTIAGKESIPSDLLGESDH